MAIIVTTRMGDELLGCYSFLAGGPKLYGRIIHTNFDNTLVDGARRLVTDYNIRAMYMTELRDTPAGNVGVILKKKLGILLKGLPGYNIFLPVGYEDRWSQLVYRTCLEIVRANYTNTTVWGYNTEHCLKGTIHANVDMESKVEAVEWYYPRLKHKLEKLAPLTKENFVKVV